MNLSEIAKPKQQSLIFAMMQKALDKDVPVYIDIDDKGKPYQGKVLGFVHWSDEKIFNVVYEKKDGVFTYNEDYRYRAPSVAMFDDAFTLKKKDGVLTFMKREKEDD